MIKASLYINEVEVDLFDDEATTISDSIKKTSSIADVGTSYTREFRIPASKTNNILFQHYYNTLIRNGFDSRRKHDAMIKVNGVDFKKGYIKLNGVDMVNNVASAYKIQFFGEMSSLKDRMGEDMLEDLTLLARYNHDYNISTVRSGFESALKSTGAGLIVNDDGELIYPFISHTRGFKYDSNGLSDVTIGGIPTSNDRLNFDDLKPAIKANVILEAMEYKYGISFGGDFRNSDMYQELFMWLHREKGFVRNGSDVENLNFQGAVTRLDPATRPAPELELALDSGNEQRDLQTYGQVGGQKGKNYKCRFEVQTTDPGTYSMTAVAIPYFTNGEPLSFNLTNQSGNSDPLEFELFSYGTGINVEYWEVWVYVNAENTISTITPIVTIDEYFGDALVDTGVYGNSVEGIVKFIDVPSNMPKMRCIDFVRGIDKLFNLVAYDQNEASYSSNREIVLQPLDDYYDSGSPVDITNVIDISKSEVQRVEPFNLIEFSYPDPKTLLAKKSNEVQRINFGNARFDSSALGQGDTSFLYDGGSYTVEIPFEKMQYERMTNLTSSVDTQIQWGWFVNDFQENEPEPEIGEPLLFFRNVRECDTDTIEWQDTGVTNTVYNSPSSVSSDGEFTLHFDAEIDEYTKTVNENGLFNKFYKRYIDGIYDIDARRLVVEGYFNSERIFNYKLNDKLIINSVAFNVEDVKINMLTRKVRLELLKITYRDEVYDVEPDKNYKGEINQTYIMGPSHRSGHFTKDSQKVYVGTEDSSRDGRCYIAEYNSEPAVFEIDHEWQPTEARGVLSSALEDDIVAHFYWQNGLSSYLAIIDYSGGTDTILSTSNLGSAINVVGERSMMIKIDDGVLVAASEVASNIRVQVITYTGDYLSATIQSDTLIHSSKQKAGLSYVGTNGAGNYVVAVASGGGLDTIEIDSITYSASVIDSKNGSLALDMIKKIDARRHIAVGPSLIKTYSIAGNGTITELDSVAHGQSIKTHGSEVEVFNNRYAYVWGVDNSGTFFVQSLVYLDDNYDMTVLGFSNFWSGTGAVAGGASINLTEDRIMIGIKTTPTFMSVREVKLT